MTVSEINNLIQDVANFPKEGVIFKDITPVLERPEAFRSLLDQFADFIKKNRKTENDKLVAIESRGFLFACGLSPLVNMGVVLARKPGKLPRETMSHTYDLEYGTDTIHIHKDAIDPGDNVFIIDDVLATGGTAHAVETVCHKMGATVLSHLFLMEISALEGRKKLEAPVEVLISY